MKTDYLDLYQRASAWTADQVRTASGQMSAPTPCDGWDVKTLLNHMLDTQRFVLESARGEDTSPPSPEPPHLLQGDPVAQFEGVQRDIIETFGEPGVMDKSSFSLVIAFGDQLVHGWDLARATNSDATMPDGLAQACYGLIHGRFSDDQRKGIFKPEIPVPVDATPQEKLLAYTGRAP